jgi:RNA 2',3'-cyclic 3'-phosphodiesterase
MRTFIGIDFSDPVKQALKYSQERLRKYVKKGRWKQPNNFHLTLFFIGEIEESFVQEIYSAIKPCAASIPPFQLSFSHIGVFRGRRHIRALWTGLGGQLHVLTRLHSCIRNAMETLGYASSQKDYIPHVTLGQDMILREKLSVLEKTVSLPSIPIITVSHVTFFKSEQIDGKRIYSSIHEYPLLGSKTRLD